MVDWHRALVWPVAFIAACVAQLDRVGIPRLKRRVQRRPRPSRRPRQSKAPSILQDGARTRTYFILQQLLGKAPVDGRLRAIEWAERVEHRAGVRALV